jgi:hypothetical protein
LFPAQQSIRKFLGVFFPASLNAIWWVVLMQSACFWSEILHLIKLPYSSSLRWHKQLELVSVVHFPIFVIYIYIYILACHSIFTFQSESLKLALEPLHGRNQLQWETHVLYSVLKPYTLPTEFTATIGHCLNYGDILILIYLSTAIGLTPGGSKHLHINNT